MISGVRRLPLRPYPDERGLFKETFRLSDYDSAGTDPFVQDNVSQSQRDVLRGLHWDPRLSKLTQVLLGQTFHVLVDVRPGSSTYGVSESFDLDADNHEQLFVPSGVANGFLVRSEIAIVHYRQTAYYNPATERILRWNDPFVSIDWPSAAPLLSRKDREAPDLDPTSLAVAPRTTPEDLFATPLPLAIGALGTAEQCPKCMSALHRSRAKSQWERWRQQITGKRPYRCRDCGWRGWGPDIGPRFEGKNIERALSAMTPGSPNLEQLDAPAEPPNRRGLLKLP